MARESRLSMTPAEARSFLASKSVLLLATLAADGVPVGDVARYALDGDALYFRLPRDGASYQNLRRDSRIACCAEQNPSYFGIAGVVLHGRAQEVTDDDEVTRLTAAINARGPALPTGARAGPPPASVLFRVPISADVMSFDFGKIQDKARSVDH